MGKGVYYNDCDPFACQWLRNLIAAGHLPRGHVDEKPIQEVKAEEVQGFTQVHFFAGIGGWPLALQLAGWDSARPVWTGSCPCQPYSPAGKGKGHEDDRNLWPEFHRLIRECRPATLIGEQVDGAVGYEWLDGVSVDLEAEGYAVGAAVLPAAGVGAPHIRHRLFWVANASSERVRADRHGSDEGTPAGVQGAAEQRQRVRPDAGDGSASGGLADHDRPRRTGEQEPHGEQEGSGEPAPRRTDAERCCEPGLWSDYLVIPCRDDKARRIPTERRFQPLAHGLPTQLDSLLAWMERLGYGRKDARGLLRRADRNRTGRLKGAGNSIVPALAAIFIRAYLEAGQEIS